MLQIIQPNHDVWYDTEGGEIRQITRVDAFCQHCQPNQPSLPRPTRPRLLHANLQLTFGCDLACSYCRTASSPLVSTRRELDTAAWMRIADDLQSDGVRSIFATGGEIFSRRDIWSLLDGFADRFIVHILTNGQAIGGELSASQRRTLRRLRSVQVSLDSATPDAHDRIRGPGSWMRAVRALETVRELGVEAVISAVATPGSEAELTALLDFGNCLNVKVLLRPLLSQGRGYAWSKKGAVDISALYRRKGIEPYVRGFLAYSEELPALGVAAGDVPGCGVITVGVQGQRRQLLDAVVGP